jgi:hypothetical protein
MRSPLYSGPNRSGVCKCGHSWLDHHLSMVMRQDYVTETGEAYVPDECCFYGSNELGGLQPVDGEWVLHCRSYRDSLESD